MSDRSFTGNECWVYQADAVDQLAGHHAALMAGALDAGDPVTCLIYAPRRGAEAGPFGVAAPSGSHALAVTKTRFVLTHDPHQAGTAPAVRSVPFDNVLSVSIGEALTLGWVAVRFVERDRSTTETIAFSSTGIDLVRAALRAWRRTTIAAARIDAGELPSLALASEIPPFLRSQLAPLVLGDEPLVDILLGRETWLPSHRGRRRCGSPWACCVVTGGGLLIGQSEAPLEPGELVFGVSVTCLDRRAIRRLSLARFPDDQEPGTTLAVEVQAGSATHNVRVRLGGLSPRDIQGRLAGVTPHIEVVR
jgi:hypothetical protein